MWGGVLLISFILLKLEKPASSSSRHPLVVAPRSYCGFYMERLSWPSPLDFWGLLLLDLGFNTFSFPFLRGIFLLKWSRSLRFDKGTSLSHFQVKGWAAILFNSNEGVLGLFWDGHVQLYCEVIVIWQKLVQCMETYCLRDNTSSTQPLTEYLLKAGEYLHPLSMK